MSDGALGRVLDPRALDEDTGARGRIRLEVPADWLAAGCRIAVVAPRRLPCARCDGGGCDACGKSGVLRAPDAADDRRLEITLPGTERNAVALRLSDPFGGGLVQQLIVEISAGTASPCVTRIPDPALRLPDPASVVLVQQLIDELRARFASPGVRRTPDPPSKFPPPQAMPWRSLIVAGLATAAAILAALLAR